MGQKYAAYATNPGPIIAFYDSVDSPVPSGVTVIEITQEQWQTCIENHGYTVSGETLVAPVAPTAAQLAATALIQSAQSALAAGIAVTCTSTPALNGTFAIDQLSQMDIIAIETSLNAGKGFPGGATTFNYPDMSGVMHSFSESNFTDFAAAVRDYVYSLKSVISGVSTTLPSASVTIA